MLGCGFCKVQSQKRILDDMTSEPGAGTKADIAAMFQRGLALHQKGALAEAEGVYKAVLVAQPAHFDALHLLGVIALQSNAFTEAVALIERALAPDPDNPAYANAYINLGVALRGLARYDAALAAYDKAVALNPSSADGFVNRGNLLIDMKRHPEGVASYDRALHLKPDYEYIFGARLHAKMHAGDWRDFDTQHAELMQRLARKERAASPFSVLTLTDSLSLQKKAAEVWAADKYPFDASRGPLTPSPRRDRIRLGYFSMDYSNHPVSALAAELFELHDRSKFEVVAFSYGAEKRDWMRGRLEQTFDTFLDVKDKSSRDIAALARRMEIDIAVDLAGYTANSRPDIFSRRAAPLQINYLGYPGTLGAPYIDYVVADRTLIAEDEYEHYTEKVVTLPHSYQANDNKRRIGDLATSRAAAGLPEDGFVFCCFNNNHKIMPAVFARWMDILAAADGSVLWLLEDNAAIADNLRHEAVQRGMDPARLVFAPRASPRAHLARHRLADLFLDTLPYNAHTTASDALWTGLPVLTCVGEAFAGRVAASLLKALGLADLITNTPAAYTALAVALARDPARLQDVRQRLAANRATQPLFNTQLYARHIEAAYAQMYERHHAGLPPAHITIGA